MSLKAALAPVCDCLLDHNGGVSCQRIATLAVCFVVLGMWVWGCLTSGQFLPLGWPEVALIGAAQGAKAMQSRFELGAGGLSSFSETGAEEGK